MCDVKPRTDHSYCVGVELCREGQGHVGIDNAC